MRWVLLLLLVLPGVASAITNLPLSCKAALEADKRCAEANFQYVPGKAGLLIATPEGVWTEWTALQPSTNIRVCPADIAPGTACPGARVTVPKSAAAADLGQAVTWFVRASWTAPTTWDDGTAMPASEIIGYLIRWVDQETGEQYEQPIGAGVTSQQLTVKGNRLCFQMQTRGKESYSLETEKVCITANARKPGAPANVTVTFGSP